MRLRTRAPQAEIRGLAMVDTFPASVAPQAGTIIFTFRKATDTAFNLKSFLTVISPSDVRMIRTVPAEACVIRPNFVCRRASPMQNVCHRRNVKTSVTVCRSVRALVVKRRRRVIKARFKLRALIIVYLDLYRLRMSVRMCSKHQGRGQRLRRPRKSKRPCCSYEIAVVRPSQCRDRRRFGRSCVRNTDGWNHGCDSRRADCPLVSRIRWQGIWQFGSSLCRRSHQHYRSRGQVEL